LVDPLGNYRDVYARAKMRMVRWMCGVNYMTDRLPSMQLTERLGLAVIVTVLEQVLTVWSCVTEDVEDVNPRGRPKRTWKEIIFDTWGIHLKIKKEDTSVHSMQWRLIRGTVTIV